MFNTGLIDSLSLCLAEVTEERKKAEKKEKREEKERKQNQAEKKKGVKESEKNVNAENAEKPMSAEDIAMRESARTADVSAVGEVAVKKEVGTKWSRSLVHAGADAFWASWNQSCAVVEGAQPNAMELGAGERDWVCVGDFSGNSSRWQEDASETAAVIAESVVSCRLRGEGDDMLCGVMKDAEEEEVPVAEAVSYAAAVAAVAVMAAPMAAQMTAVMAAQVIAVMAVMAAVAVLAVTMMAVTAKVEEAEEAAVKTAKAAETKATAAAVMAPQVVNQFNHICVDSQQLASYTMQSTLGMKCISTNSRLGSASVWLENITKLDSLIEMIFQQSLYDQVVFIIHMVYFNHPSNVTVGPTRSAGSDPLPSFQRELSITPAEH